MDSEQILTFRAPARGDDRVEAVVSPVLELIYAAYFLQRRGANPPGSGHRPAWLTALNQTAPAALEQMAGFWKALGLDQPGVESFVLAARYGYVRDADPGRWLDDMPKLAQRALTEPLDGHEDDPSSSKIAERLGLLADPVASQAWAAAYRELWQALAPFWAQEGAPVAKAAAESFRQQFQASGDVVSALPAYHHVRFEASTHAVRRAEAEGRLVVVPLALAVAGGFHFDVDEVLYIGFGLMTESVHHRTVSQVSEVAQRMKALADPTRATLLALIGRFSGLQFTVGDLAVQLGVSQPTVSGHLRLLREAGLVRLEKRGNKSFHEIDAEALKTLLRTFERAVLEGPGEESEPAKDR